MIPSELFTFPESLKIFSKFFPRDVQPWEWIPQIEKALLAFGTFSKDAGQSGWLSSLVRKIVRFLPGVSHSSSYCQIGKNVTICKGVKLPAFCTIGDNVYIGAGTEIRSGALIRGNVIIGENCVIGNACEIKNCLIMDNVQISHLNYLGDSILGSFSHIGGGVILSNLRFDGKNVDLKINNEIISTGLRKFGAILGENAQVGCNSVLLPGTILSRYSIVSTSMSFGGFLEEYTVAFTSAKCEKKTFLCK